MSGLFLIDPAFEGLFAVKKNQDSPPKQSSEKIVTWPDLWYKKIVPHYQGKWFTSVIGFNRISLMLGLMSPVEDNKLLGILSKDIITRKVSIRYKKTLPFTCSLLCTYVTPSIHPSSIHSFAHPSNLSIVLYTTHPPTFTSIHLLIILSLIYSLSIHPLIYSLSIHPSTFPSIQLFIHLITRHPSVFPFH